MRHLPNLIILSSFKLLYCILNTGHVKYFKFIFIVRVQPEEIILLSCLSSTMVDVLLEEVKAVGCLDSSA